MSPTPGVKVTLIDGVYHLRFTNRSLVKLEEKTDLTLQELGERLTAGSFKAISALVWAGLLHSEPGLTFDAAVDRIDLKDLKQVGSAVGEAVAAALGTGDDAEEAADEGTEGSAEGNATAAA